MKLIIWHLGITVAATFMVIHDVDTAVKAARDAYLSWYAPRAKDDGNRD
jgi:hypothetical protein